MTTIKADVSVMFAAREPWDCSNSIANLGDQAGRLTWECALEVAADAGKWLLSDRADALAGIVEWAHDTGAWDEEETAKWSDEDCLALFVQNVASDLREWLDSDNQELESSVHTYETTDWDKESGSPTGHYYIEAAHVTVDYYTGS
jgi:hypothetical protein